LRQIDEKTGEITDLPFKFIDQEHYESLGESITDHVYDLLIENGLHKIHFPEDAAIEQSSFIFSTSTNLKNAEKLMLIIHGSGVVRAGQWARSLIINDCLDSGTVLPYVKKARADGYEVIITNTNDNRRHGKKVIGSDNPEVHAENVWKTFVQPSNAKQIAIVAHSYGGVVTTSLASKFKKDFEEKVFAVAFTDSVHSSRGVTSKLKEVGVNFVASDSPANTRMKSYNDDDMERRSAGHSKHEMTSYACIEHLFEFIKTRLEVIDSGNPPDSKKIKSDL
jgi:hypothetical protein